MDLLLEQLLELLLELLLVLLLLLLSTVCTYYVIIGEARSASL